VHNKIYGAALLVLLLIPSSTFAETRFNISASPPRFILQTKPGKIVRETVRFTNVDKGNGIYHLKTADWELLPSGAVKFYENAPVPGSCRPWVRIERRVLSIRGNSSKNFRFEMHVPKDATAAECRFAILISPDPKTIQPVRVGKIALPVVGRIGIIVYLRVGKVKPKLKVLGLSKGRLNKKTIPILLVKNIGNAHGRPTGSLVAKDAKGRKIDLEVDQFPIMPGKTRRVPLKPVKWTRKGHETVTFKLRFPMHIRGKVEWDGGSVKIDRVLR
jgi:hypothetical protein